MSGLTDATLSKVALRIVPILFIGAILANLDRSNVGMAALQMNADIGLSPSTYGLGVGAFFIVYALFEVPSNAALARFGARLWLTRIMITWGILSAASALVSGPVSFVLNRALLGAAEAGFHPGVLAFLATWFPARYRARVFACFLTAVPLAVVVGGPLSAWLLSFDGMLGLRGWQWLFIIEGLPPIMLAAFLWRTLRDSPAQAPWLSPTEASALTAELDSAGAHRPKRSIKQWARAIASPAVFLFTAVLSCLGGINHAVTFWLPQIVKSTGLTTTATGWVIAIPYLISVPVMILWSRHSDRTGERRWHIAAPAVLAGLALTLAVFAPGLVARMALISVALTCVFSVQAVFWSAVSATLPAGERTVGMAVINAGGTLFAFLAPSLIGLSKQLTGGFDAAFFVLGGMGIMGGLLAVVLIGHMPSTTVRQAA